MGRDDQRKRGGSHNTHTFYSIVQREFTIRAIRVAIMQELVPPSGHYLDDRRRPQVAGGRRTASQDVGVPPTSRFCRATCSELTFKLAEGMAVHGRVLTAALQHALVQHAKA